MNLKIFKLTEKTGEKYSYVVRAWDAGEAIATVKKMRITNYVTDGGDELYIIRQILDQEYSVEDVSDESIFYLDRD